MGGLRHRWHEAQAARQRALPKTEDLPPAQRRLDEVCAAGYAGRKRGEVVRTRTVVSQAHTSQWLGSFGNRGNGEYRKELALALVVIRRYLEALGLPQTRALLRLDGLYGTGAVIADLDGLFFVMRGKDYAVLDHPTVQARLHLPPDAHFSRPESTLVRTLYDCPDVPVGKTGCRCRVVVATHLATEKKSRIGRTRKGVVYELFFTHLPQDGFTASDVVALAPPIVVLLNRCLPMKMTNRTPIAGAVMHPLDKKPGNSSVNGSGTCAWSWAISLSQLRCAPPSLLLLSPLSHRTRLLLQALLPLRWACPGKQTASLVKTFLSSRMGRCGVLLANRWLPMSNAEKPMGACASSMRPVFVVAVPVPCASSVNGRAAPPRSRAR